MQAQARVGRRIEVLQINRLEVVLLSRGESFKLIYSIRETCTESAYGAQKTLTTMIARLTSEGCENIVIGQLLQVCRNKSHAQYQWCKTILRDGK